MTDEVDGGAGAGVTDLSDFKAARHAVEVLLRGWGTAAWLIRAQVGFSGGRPVVVAWVATKSFAVEVGSPRQVNGVPVVIRELQPQGKGKG